MAAVSSLSAFRFQFPLSLKLLCITWVFMFAIELVGHILQSKGIRNHWLYNIFNPLFYILLALIYKRVIASSAVKRIIITFFIVFPLFIVINSLFIQGLGSLQTLTIVIGGSFVVLLSGVYFWQLYQSDSTEKISHDPFFWFSFGFVLYFGGTVPYLGMLNYLWKISQEFTRFYFVYFYNVFSIVLNVLVTIGFLCRRNYPKLP
jgi:hypothetical protein